MKRDYLVYPSMIGAKSGIIWAPDSLEEPTIFDDSKPLNVSASKCHNTTMCVWYVSPVWQFNDPDKFVYALFGDLTRWTGVSRQQIISIDKDFNNNNITITVQGFPNQLVRLFFSVFINVEELVSCGTSDTSGQARFVVAPHKISCA